MKFDVSKLKEMNELDFEQIAIWPFEVKVVVAAMLSIVAAAVTFYGIVNDKLSNLNTVKAKEVELKQQYKGKYGIASNLEEYQKQLEQLKSDFSKMLNSLPTSNETPGLLDDITYVGTTAGLTFRLLNWQQEVPKEFYTELPIRIEVTGQYHEFGKFLSDVAGLPRIVTVHDFDMSDSGSGLNLRMSAKTYRTSLDSELP